MTPLEWADKCVEGHPQWQPSRNNIAKVIADAITAEREEVTKNEEMQRLAKAHETETKHKSVFVPAREALFFCDGGPDCVYGGVKVNPESNIGGSVNE